MSLSIKAAGFSILTLLALFLLTSPSQLPSVFLITPFFLLFAIILVTVIVILSKNGVSRSRRHRVSLLIATPVVLLLVLQSLGQLTLRDTAVVMILFGLGYFYISRLAIAPTR